MVESRTYAENSRGNSQIKGPKESSGELNAHVRALRRVGRHIDLGRANKWNAETE